MNRILYISIIVSIISICTNLIFTIKETGKLPVLSAARVRDQNILEHWQKESTLNYTCKVISQKHIYSLFSFVESVRDMQLVEFTIRNGQSEVTFKKDSE